MSRPRLVFSIIAIAIIICACDNKAPNEDNKPLPSESASGIGGSEDGAYLSIQKDVMDQKFLMQSAIAVQKGAGDYVSNPTSNNLKSHVVTFEERGEDLLMLEDADGFKPGEEIPAHILLASFPIKERKDNLIFFDFNKGMTDVVIAWDWFTSDQRGTRISNGQAVSVENSYLRRVGVAPEATTVIETLTIKDQSAGSTIVPVEITYNFSRYRDNPNYVPVESPGFRYLGYFEANPLVQKDFGVPYTYITRWDITKPVTYMISQAVPEEYRDAVSEGVLYWNRVFGKNIVEVKIAPEVMVDFDFQNNVIQWHTDNNAAAYADFSIDPKTGEILRVQIYIPSAFAQWSRYHAGFKNRDNGDNAGDAAPPSDAKNDETGDELSLSASQIEETRLCNLYLDEVVQGLVSYQDILQALPEERAQAVAKDFVRDVVAHEVGHTLGLRHNFAASSVSEWSAKEEEAVFKGYLKTGAFPDDIKIPFNSVMDYPNFEMRVIIGALIGNSDTPALPYDRYAVDWAYNNYKQKPAFKGQVFCTDSQVVMFDDCVKRDSGKHIVERKLGALSKSFNEIPKTVYEAYASAKANFNPRFRRPVNESTPYAGKIASSVAQSFSELNSLFTRDISLISIFDKYPDLTDIDEKKMTGETKQWLSNEIRLVGGLRSIFGLIDPATFKKTFEQMSGQFDAMMSSDTYKAIFLPEGGSVALTEDEISYMKRRAKELFPEIREKLAFALTSELQGAPSKPLDGIAEVESLIAGWAEYIITDGNQTNFTYLYETRKNAVGLLGSKGPYPDWLKKYLQPIAQKLHARLEEVLGQPPESVDITKFPRDEQQRVIDEIKLYQMLTMLSGPVPAV